MKEFNDEVFFYHEMTSTQAYFAGLNNALVQSEHLVISLTISSMGIYITTHIREPGLFPGPLQRIQSVF